MEQVVSPDHRMVLLNKETDAIEFIESDNIIDNLYINRINTTKLDNDTYTFSLNKEEVSDKVEVSIDILDVPVEVYCLTVPTSSFVIRYNNKVSVTGNCHTTFSLHMLNILRSGQEGKDYQDYYQELIPTFKQIVLETYEQEKAWAKHLFKDGAIIGVNEATSIQYLEYLIDFNITQAGLEPMFGKPNNPYPWIKHWFNSDAVQVTPQETEMTSYVLSPDGNISGEDVEEMGDIEL